ncbi:hypothetical protein ABGV42_01735 [Paenibacillus pabuli]|uniref:hypothetical protein n=1 Tax=Paenibacillus pabuli TaxID=1472 RepID=UPI003242D3BB
MSSYNYDAATRLPLADFFFHSGLNFDSRLIEVAEKVYNEFQNESYDNLTGFYNGIMFGGEYANAYKSYFERIHELYDVTDDEPVFALPIVKLIAEKQNEHFGYLMQRVSGVQL